MAQIKKYLIFMIFVFVLLISSTALADEIWVRPDGSGDYTTITDAVAAAQPGDTIMVAKGIYYETINIEKCGTKGKPITLRAESNGLNDVIITAANKDIREGKVTWTLAEGTEDIYWIDWDKNVGSVMANDIFLLYTKTLDVLFTRSENGGYLGFPQNGYFWDPNTNRLYVRLGKRYFDDLNPNNNVMKVGGECFKWEFDDGVTQSGEGDKTMVVRKNTNNYNIGIWTEADSWINIDGFTFETPGFGAIYIRGHHVNVRDCWFRGCRIGVKGGAKHWSDRYTSNYCTVSHCDFSLYPLNNECNDMVYDRRENPEAYKDDTAQYFYWGPKGKAVMCTYEVCQLVSGAGYYWDIGHNYMHEAFEGLSMMWTQHGVENPVPGDIDGKAGGFHKVHDNKIYNTHDNSIELENMIHNTEVYNNEFVNALNHVSWQPLGGYPLPKNLYIHNNLIYNTPEHEDAWNGGGDPFKLGAPKSNFTLASMNEKGFWPKNGSNTEFNRQWFGDDKGVMIYNNTVITPGKFIIARMGNFDTSDQYGGSGFMFYNNIFNVVAQYPNSGEYKWILVGSFWEDRATFDTKTNILLPSNPEVEFSKESKYIPPNYPFYSAEEAGLTFTVKDGVENFEITNPDSVAVKGGTQVPIVEEDTTYVGAVPYGKEWKIYYGVYPRGDVNFDNIVDEKDIMVLASLMGTDSDSKEFVSHGDIDFNGVLDENDIIEVNKIIAGGIAG